MTDQRKAVLDEKRHVSTNISNLCRYIAFGTVAVNWALITSTAQFASSIAASAGSSLMLSATGGILAILFDYLQFLAGYFSVNKALDSTDNTYNTALISYKLRVFFFWAKQAAAVIGILILILVVTTNI